MINKSFEILNNTLIFLKYNLFLIYGENNGLKKDIVENIKKTIHAKDSNVEFMSLNEADIQNNEEIFNNILYSGSLFSKKKVLIIRDSKGKIMKQIEEVVDNYPAGIKIIILSDLLDKKSGLRNFFEKNTRTLTIPCYPDSEKDLEIIATLKFKKNNIILSRESINLLIEKSNFDRGNLKNEIEKIISFANSKGEITIEQVRSLINFAGEYKSDSLINECLCGNIQQYKKILSESYLNTINQILLFRILNKKILRLLNMKKVVKDYKDVESLINASRPPIFWKEKSIVKKQLHIWKIKDLQKMIKEINNIELICKKKPQISKIVFFDLFSRICIKANSFS